MRLINQNRRYTVSLDAVSEFENIILADSQIRRTNKIIGNKLFISIIYRIWRLTKKVKYLPIYFIKKDYFAVLMGPDFSKCIPFLLSQGKKNLYLFDAWSSSHENIKKFINDFNINNVFVSSSQVAEMLHSSISICKLHWIPEGINPNEYKYNSYSEKNIDVLQLGRKYEKYHNLIVGGLEKLEIIYLYEKVKGEIIFPDRKQFIDGLARTKISICFPSNITHPERAGKIETMTLRYLQSMISKCLIIGYAPSEMIKLFGYNPVVEIDWKNPLEQIRIILENFNDFIPQIERNYESVFEHTWTKRWQKISKILFYE